MAVDARGQGGAIRIGSRHDLAEPEGIGFHGGDGLTEQLARAAAPAVLARLRVRLLRR
jgi:hypothetical protein